ncbi:biopolymer transporter ExbD [Vibrio tapetis]|uniref:Membrane spanning protein in TonB-ExbB-ExbD complex n=1 Tax=Vibrio tapetis subsp. tapetis TaxID=1671868 RepID=A0A2N8ZLM0_9VIBR|nr:biopolymer transporter ExbD [Vibrio tapetis]MDN3681204.1 biopolymer transporter ExbD [Vibrio tapetis subsp. quintayensis]SON52795.1 membrane spanning protein in TonB-ExbB-ExbD complex [Vibrio tapetis subsp. tapetis]
MAFRPNSNSDEMVENHDINITPLVDVMLVLLIIVMVAAPLATVNVPVDLPTSSAKPQPQPDEPFYLTVQQGLILTLGEEKEVSLAQLPLALDTQLMDKSKRIFLRADKNLTYQDLMTVMNTVVAAGYSHIALVGEEKPADSNS